MLSVNGTLKRHGHSFITIVYHEAGILRTSAPVNPQPRRTLTDCSAGRDPSGSPDWLESPFMKPVQFSLQRLLLAVALTAAALSMMLALRTSSDALVIAACIVIGATFGAAIGVLLNRLKVCVALGACGWFLFAIYALLT